LRQLSKAHRLQQRPTKVNKYSDEVYEIYCYCKGSYYSLTVVKVSRKQDWHVNNCKIKRIIQAKFCHCNLRE